MPKVPVVRFAPSPTGFLHVGGAHSALANWLVARRTGGRFLLRIEDTDAARDRPELVENVLDVLRWLGLDWDEEPVRQSTRTDEYLAAADTLASSGAAYWCDCLADAVAERARARGGPPGYDGHCRHRGLERGEGRALRFRTPDTGDTGWTDLVRGEVSFAHANLEDFVLVRSSGAPMFLLANAVDDAAMGITHVIRGEDHVNGTPKYLLIRGALGLGQPEAFAHMPLLVNEGRKKLSKRRDDVSVADYRDRGFLPEAMLNYLALLGWGPADHVEVRPIRELVDLYRLEDVNPSPAFFDLRKLSHVNAEWIRSLSVDEFLARAAPFLPAGDAPAAALADLAPLVQERVRTLDEAGGMVAFLWADEVEVDEASWDKAMARGKAAPELLAATIAGFEGLVEEGHQAWTADAISRRVEVAAAAVGLVNAEGRPQMSKAQAPVRVATTGRSVGPPLWESLVALGPDRTLARLRRVAERLGC